MCPEKNLSHSYWSLGVNWSSTLMFSTCTLTRRRPRILHLWRSKSAWHRSLQCKGMCGWVISSMWDSSNEEQISLSVARSPTALRAGYSDACSGMSEIMHCRVMVVVHDAVNVALRFLLHGIVSDERSHNTFVLMRQFQTRTPTARTIESQKECGGTRWITAAYWPFTPVLCKSRKRNDHLFKSVNFTASASCAVTLVTWRWRPKLEIEHLYGQTYQESVAAEYRFLWPRSVSISWQIVWRHTDVFSNQSKWSSPEAFCVATSIPDLCCPTLYIIT